MFRRITFFIPLLLVMMSCIAYAAPGDLDTTFNPPNGFVTYHGGNPGYGYAVALQADGKIVVVGHTAGEVPVLRYNPDGSLDGGFGTGGVATYFGGYWDYGRAVALQADGKIVVAGLTYIGGNYDVLLLRYNPDGSLDGGFGTGGVATYDGGNPDSGYAVALQADGKIVVAGETHNGADCDVLVLRYNPDGSLDGGFGTGGIATYDSGSWDRGRAVALQADGKIVVAGFTTDASGNFLVLRYNPDGSLDGGFGTGGVATYYGGNWAFGCAVALQADGKIVVAGFTDGVMYDVLVLRYNPDGSLDSDFGTGGGAIYDSGGWDQGLAVSLRADGKIVVAGEIHNGANLDVLVLRYNPDGSLDSDFGTGGVATYDSGNNDSGYAVALQTDGKIIVAGYTDNDVLVLRLIGGGTGSAPPNAPTNLTATVVSSNPVDLSWTDNSPDEDGFKIERKTSSAGSFSQIATVAADTTSYNDTTVTLGQSYYYCYRVRAYNTNGDSGYSNEAAVSYAPSERVDFGKTDGSACFIATAAYGSSIDPQVNVLREFRDRFLLNNPMGRAFVDFYYEYSPKVADFIAIKRSLQAAVRWSLLPLIGLSWIVLHLGPEFTVLLMVLLIVLVSTVAVACMKPNGVRS